LIQEASTFFVKENWTDILHFNNNLW